MGSKDIKNWDGDIAWTGIRIAALLHQNAEILASHVSGKIDMDRLQMGVEGGKKTQ